MSIITLYLYKTFKPLSRINCSTNTPSVVNIHKVKYGKLCLPAGSLFGPVQVVGGCFFFPFSEANQYSNFYHTEIDLLNHPEDKKKKKRH